ncbi:MAG: UDP-N-acetylmuramoyl-tripeptide--D-alanyl-D-alanine ligase [Firmicutes bacterium]|nr:UDP-N-acetylmuramoyl-tripeptide--D-alanyl-D-alanine ligase [Bacillota bacterium]
MNKLTLGEICAAVGGKTTADENIIINSITTDSRKIEEGCLFIALSGERFDGHDFIPSSFEKGAVCCLSEKEGFEGNVIFVEDTKKALRDLAEYYLSILDIKVVGITGSVGKTTTKDMIASVLAQKYNVLKTDGNFNNEIGLPLTVFRLDSSHEVAVLEMGMSEFGEISNLTKIAKPDVAVITNVGVSHIENLGSREGILKAKCEIFEGLKNGGTAVLNLDNDMISTLKDKTDFNAVWFGVENKGDFYAEDIRDKGLEGIDCKIVSAEERFDVSISVPGNHMVLNALSAAAVGKTLGLTSEEIKAGIECFVPTGMRMSVEKSENGYTIINDVYNANPVSMKAAIDVLKKAEGRRTAIMGDMFELGTFSKSLHEETGKYASESGVEKLIFIGEASKYGFDAAVSEGSSAVYYKTVDEFLNDDIKSFFAKDETILVKASRGMHFERIVERLHEVK